MEEEASMANNDDECRLQFLEVIRMMDQALITLGKREEFQVTERAEKTVINVIEMCAVD